MNYIIENKETLIRILNKPNTSGTLFKSKYTGKWYYPAYMGMGSGEGVEIDPSLYNYIEKNKGDILAEYSTLLVPGATDEDMYFFEGGTTYLVPIKN